MSVKLLPTVKCRLNNSSLQSLSQWSALVIGLSFNNNNSLQSSTNFEGSFANENQFLLSSEPLLAKTLYYIYAAPKGFDITLQLEDFFTFHYKCMLRLQWSHTEDDSDPIQFHCSILLILAFKRLIFQFTLIRPSGDQKGPNIYFNSTLLKRSKRQISLKLYLSVIKFW